MNLPIPDISCKRNLLVLVFPTQHDFFQRSSMAERVTPFMAEEYSIRGVDHTSFFPLSGDGHVGCLHLLAVVNTAAVNTHVHLFESLFSDLLDVCPGSGIAGSCGHSMLNLFRHR